MSKDKTSQSLNITGGQISQVQIGGQASRDVNAKQHQNIGLSPDEGLNVDEITALLTQLEMIFQASKLPAEHTKKAIKHLAVAKEEVQTQDPDKEFAAKNLQRATSVLRDAGETVEAGTGLWKKIEPIINKLVSWLGVAVSVL